MMQAVIIHGPQGCGKTRHAKDFCELYGCTAWTDDWLPCEPLVPGLLHLTFEVPSGLPGRDVQIISFDEAMKALGEKIVVRHLGTTTWQGPANQVPEFLGSQPKHNIAPVVSPTQMERLAFLIKECGEVIQEATKIMRFGFDSYHPADPTQETNRDRLFREMTDVMASYDILVRAGDIHSDHVPNITAARDRKLSRARGLLRKPTERAPFRKLTVTFIDGDVHTYILNPTETFTYLAARCADEGGTITVKGRNLEGKPVTVNTLAGVAEHRIEDVPQ